MKLNIIQIPTIAETKITIECRYISKRIQRIIATIRNIETHLPCYQEKTFLKFPLTLFFILILLTIKRFSIQIRILITVSRGFMN